jgi:hypothetical protein
MGEAGLESLPVSVNIGEERYQHGRKLFTYEARRRLNSTCRPSKPIPA